MFHPATTPRSLFRAVLAALLLVLTGCIEIREEYFIRADGSGRFRLSFDFSAFNGMEGMDSGPAAAASGQTGEVEDDFGKIDSSMQQVSSRLNSIRGLSAVQVAHPEEGADRPDLKLSLQFAFANLDALAEGLAVLKRNLAERPDSLGGIEEQFRLAGGRFSRRSASPLLTEELWKQGEPGPEAGPASGQPNGEEEAGAGPGSMMDEEKMAKLMGSLFSYRVRYTFEQSVRGSTYERSTTSLDGRTLELTAPISALKKTPGMLSGSIELE